MSEKIKAFFIKAGLSISLIIIGIIIGLIIFAQFGRTESIFDKPAGISVPQVTLDQVKMSYVPETEEILFIDRNKNVVVLVLSKEATTAIYSLKASAMQNDYEAKKNDPTPAPSKRPAASSQTQQSMK